MRLAGRLIAGLAAVTALVPLAGAAQQLSRHTPVIAAAEYAEPTARYTHGVLGDAVEWGSLRLWINTCKGCAGIWQQIRDINLPPNRVFEDVAPRMIDLDGAGGPEVIVVESDLELGARLAIYDADGLLTATEFIGQRNRWLAPIGAADLDGDGAMEIAYIDRPHLAKILRVLRFQNGRLTHVADLDGYTNHRIGERDIAGGIRACDGAPEMIVATADWARVVAVRFDGARFAIRDLGPHRGRASFGKALEC